MEYDESIFYFFKAWADIMLKPSDDTFLLIFDPSGLDGLYTTAW